jgi:hypothetical protein
MFSLRRPALALIFVALVGCSSQDESIERDVRDPAIYGGYVKSRIVSYLERARKNPTGGEKQTAFLVEMLQNYKSAPIGDHEDTYQDLLANCEQLRDMYGSSASRSKVNQKIDEIIVLAKQLPGELEINPDG